LVKFKSQVFPRVRGDQIPNTIHCTHIGLL
jgi:hypothetical protein